MIFIGIVDDDTLVARLLTDFFKTSSDFNVIFNAVDGNDLINRLEIGAEVIPDILLLDLRMKGKNGVETIEYLRMNYASIKIIVISSYYQDSYTGFLFKSGVNAFVPKEVSPEYLREIIKVVYDQGYYFSQEQLLKLRQQISSKTPKPSVEDILDLSSRELEVLKLICQQKTAKEIGDILNISTKTVEGHRGNLLLKTGVKNVVGLVIYALQNKILEVEELDVYSH